MDNLDILNQRVKDIIKAANQENIDVGAVRGVMATADTVIIKGKTYHAIQGTQVASYPGAQVWCQLSSNSTAVIIGG